MNRKSMIVWGGIAALLVVSALLSALWPSIRPGLPTGSGVAGPQVETETEPIHLTIPPALVEVLPLEEAEIEINPFVAIAVLGAIVVGGIVVMGGGLAFLYTRLDQTNAEMVSSDKFQENVKSLEETEKQRLKELNQDKEVVSKTEADYETPRWSVISTSLLILMFVTFVATAVSDTFYPEREMEIGEQVVNAPGVFIAVFVLITLLVMVLGFRPKTLATIDGDETSAIPWDTIYLLITGFLVIVVGTGLILWLRQPVG